MNIQFASDLHLEFSQNKEFLRLNPLQPAGEILFLAGDIVPFAKMHKHDDFFSYISDHFQITYWIPGNHEYYNYDIAKKSGTLNEKIKSNVFLVNNTSAVHNNVKFIFSTLWSKISPTNEWYVIKGMSDFQVINHNDSIFSPFEYNQLHEESIRFIKEEQQHNNTDKTLVITHHVPTFFNYPPQYKGDILNEAFAVELFDFIETNGPRLLDLWTYPHQQSGFYNW